MVVGLVVQAQTLQAQTFDKVPAVKGMGFKVTMCMIPPLPTPHLKRESHPHRMGEEDLNDQGFNVERLLVSAQCCYCCLHKD